MHGYYYASLVQEFAGLKEEEFYIDPPTAAISSGTLGRHTSLTSVETVVLMLYIQVLMTWVMS